MGTFSAREGIPTDNMSCQNRTKLTKLQSLILKLAALFSLLNLKKCLINVVFFQEHQQEEKMDIQDVLFLFFPSFHCEGWIVLCGDQEDKRTSHLLCLLVGKSGVLCKEGSVWPEFWECNRMLRLGNTRGVSGMSKDTKPGPAPRFTDC